MTMRSQNQCLECGYTWFPRGKSLSRQCPNCRSSEVDFYYEPEEESPRERSLWGDIASFLGGLISFYFVTLFNPWGFVAHLLIYSIIAIHLETIKSWLVLTVLGTLGYYVLKWLVPKLWMKFCKKG